MYPDEVNFSTVSKLNYSCTSYTGSVKGKEKSRKQISKKSKGNHNDKNRSTKKSEKDSKVPKTEQLKKHDPEKKTTPKRRKEERQDKRMQER